MMHNIAFYNHAKNQKLFMTNFWKMDRNTNFLHLIPLIPMKYEIILKWCLFLPSTIVQYSETLNEPFLGKYPNIPTFDT